MGTRLWRQAGWVRRMALVLFGAALIYAASQIVLGRMQADFDYLTFSAGKPYSVHLAPEERRNVYLTAEESLPLNFDFYPSDLTCEMQGPDRVVDPGTEIYAEHRLVDGWNSFWGVESFEAAVAGEHELLCIDHSDRTYPLILARPSSSRTYGVYPEFGVLLVTIAGILLATTWLVAGRRSKTAPEPPEPT